MTRIYKKVAIAVGAKQEWIAAIEDGRMTLEDSGIDYQTYKILTHQ